VSKVENEKKKNRRGEGEDRRPVCKGRENQNAPIRKKQAKGERRFVDKRKGDKKMRGEKTQGVVMRAKRTETFPRETGEENPTQREWND